MKNCVIILGAMMTCLLSSCKMSFIAETTTQRYSGDITIYDAGTDKVTIIKASEVEDWKK